MKETSCKVLYLLYDMQQGAVLTRRGRKYGKKREKEMLVLYSGAAGGRSGSGDDIRQRHGGL